MKRLLINITLLLTLWESCYYLDVFSGTLPSLFDVIAALLTTKLAVEILISLLTTLRISLLGVLIGTLIGYFFGILTGLYPTTLKPPIYSYLNGLKAIPVTILLPLILIVFGYQQFATALISIPIIAIIGVNISEACNGVNKNRVSIIKFLPLSNLNYWYHILRWETLIVLFASLRIVISYALALQIAFEYFLLHVNGIGKFISLSYGAERYTDTYAAILFVSIIGISLIKLLDIFSKQFLKWKTQT